MLYTAYRNCQRAIRDDRWKLIRYPLVDRTQLFDLAADPHELNNLADKPEHAAKLAELTAMLEKEMAAHGDRYPLKIANPKPAAPHTADSKPSTAPHDDTAWLREKGKLIFHDTFEREETGIGLKAIGNGWESATADRVPHIKMADLDGGILKITSASNEAGHSAHIHHEAGFSDGGASCGSGFPA